MPDWLVGLLILLGLFAALMLAQIVDKLSRIIKLLEAKANRD